MAFEGIADSASDWSGPDWELIAESIPHIVWMFAPDGRAEYFNRRGVEYTGLEAEETYGWGWMRLIHPDDVEHAGRVWDQALRTGTPYVVDNRVRRANGEFRWQAARCLPVRDATGKVVKWIGTLTDIEDQKRYEGRLIDAQRTAAEALTLLETLQGAAPVGFGFVDRDYRIVRINEALAAIDGVPIEQQRGRTVAEAVPELWDKLEPVFRHVLHTGEAVRNLPLAGQTAAAAGPREWLASYYPVRIDDEIIGVGVVVVDVTERVQAEGFRSAVMSQVSDGVYTVDRDGLLTYMNRAASKMLGWSEDELRGKCMHDVVHCQMADGTPVAGTDCGLLAEATSGGIVRAVGEAFTRKDGSIFAIACSAVPIRFGSRLEGVAVVFRDVTQPRAFPSLIRVLIADSHRTTGEAFQALLNRGGGVEVVSVTTTSASAVAATQRLRPDVVVVDDGLPDLDGAATTARIKANAPETSVILMTDKYDESIAIDGIAAGCAGVLDKGRAWVELPGAVHAAHSGEATISQAELQRVLSKVRDRVRPGRGAELTEREREVLACITQGLSNPGVAERLGVTPNTVRNHVQRILSKLGVHSKLEAVVVATREGLVQGELDTRRQGTHW